MIQRVIEFTLLLVALVHAQHALVHSGSEISGSASREDFSFLLILEGVKCPSSPCTFEGCLLCLQKEKCELSAGFLSLIFICFGVFP